MSEKETNTTYLWKLVQFGTVPVFQEPNRVAAVLGIDAAQFQSPGDPVDRQHVRGNAVVHFMRFGEAHDFIEGILPVIEEALVDLAFAPEKALTVLHPFEVADGHAACVAENVRHGEDAL